MKSDVHSILHVLVHNVKEALSILALIFLPKTFFFSLFILYNTETVVRPIKQVTYLILKLIVSTVVENLLVLLAFCRENNLSEIILDELHIEDDIHWVMTVIHSQIYLQSVILEDIGQSWKCCI